MYSSLSSWPLLYGVPLRWWACFIGAAFALVVALAKLAPLTAPNRLWMKFGMLLGHVVSPIAFGILFYAVLTPVSVMMRLTGNPLRRSRDLGAASYWLPRRPPELPPDSITNQF